MSYDSRGMNHTEGGWPKDINHLDAEQTMRFKKKIEKDDMYIHSVHQLSHVREFKKKNVLKSFQKYFNFYADHGTLHFAK